MSNQINRYEIRATLVRQKDGRFKKQEVPLSIAMECSAYQFWLLLGQEAHQVFSMIRDNPEAADKLDFAKLEAAEHSAVKRMLQGNVRYNSMDYLKEVSISNLGPVAGVITYKQIGENHENS